MHKERIRLIFFVFIIIIFALNSLTTTAYAGGGKNKDPGTTTTGSFSGGQNKNPGTTTNTNSSNSSNKNNEGTSKFDESVFKGDRFALTAWRAVYKVYSPDLLSELGNIVTTDPDDGIFGDVWNVIAAENGVMGKVIPVGYLLLILYFLIEMAEKTTHDNFNIEHMLRLFIKLFIGIMLIGNVRVLTTGFLGFGNAMLATVGSSDDTAVINEEVLNDYYTFIQDAGLFELLGIYLEFAIPSIFIGLCTLLARLVCYTRLFEICIRASLAPIGMVDIFSDGTRGNGFRYLRKLLAVCIQGALIVLVIKLMAIIQASLINNMGTTGDANMWAQVLVACTTVGLLFKSQSFANDVLGV